MANTEKSKAELYREERKARLAKAAKKNAKKQMSSALKAVIAVVLVAVIAAGACGYSYASLGIARQHQTVMNVADITDISYAEYQYYYNQTFSYYFNSAAQYEQYYASYYGEGAGAMMMGGYDYTISPEEQAFPESHADYATIVEKGYENPTWADYFEYLSLYQLGQMKVLNAMADKAGYKLSDELKKEIAETYDQMKQAAGQSMTSVNKYLQLYYGKGVTKGLIKKIINEQEIAQHYQEVLKDEYRAALTEKEIKDNYKDNKDLYDVAGIAFYTVSAEKVETKGEDGETTEAVTSKTMKAAKEKAEALAKASGYSDLSDKVKAAGGSLQTMEGQTKDTVSQYLSEEVANWLFSSKTKTGDIKVVEQSQSGYLVACAYSLPERDDTKMVTIRQIEIEIPEEEEEAAEEAEEAEEAEDAEELSEEELAEKEEADKKAQEEAEAAKKAEEEAAAKKAEEDKNTPALDSFTDAPVFNDVAKKTSDEDTYLDAEILLRKYLAGDRTEEAFKALADTKAEADPSSEDYEDESLVENIYPNSGNVDEKVEAWALDKSRKAGDVGIVECEGEAYYIVYFVETKEDSHWENEVKDALAYEKIQADIDAHETTVTDTAAVEAIIADTMVLAKKQIAAAASSSTASY